MRHWFAQDPRRYFYLPEDGVSIEFIKVIQDLDLNELKQVLEEIEHKIIEIEKLLDIEDSKRDEDFNAFEWTILMDSRQEFTFKKELTLKLIDKYELENNSRTIY